MARCSKWHSGRFTLTRALMTLARTVQAEWLDELPAGVETVNPDFKMLAGMYDVPEPRTWLDLSHVERRDRKTMLYFDQMATGSTSYSVLARVNAGGTFRWPSATVSPMYDLRTSGQSAASEITVAAER